MAQGPAPDPNGGAESHSPANLAIPEERGRLTPAAAKALVRLAGIWRLTNAEMCGLLGGISARTWFRIKGGSDTAPWSQDQLTRSSLLIGTFKGLRLLFAEGLADEWMKIPNANPLFAGRRPVDALIEGGIPKMLEARRYVDALRGGL